MSYWLGFNK